MHKVAQQQRSFLSSIGVASASGVGPGRAPLNALTLLPFHARSQPFETIYQHACMEAILTGLVYLDAPPKLERGDRCGLFALASVALLLAVPRVLQREADLTTSNRRSQCFHLVISDLSGKSHGPPGSRRLCLQFLPFASMFRSLPAHPNGFAAVVGKFCGA